MSDKVHSQTGTNNMADLPTPNAAAQAHSLELQAVVKQEIKDQTGISFQRFMELALYHPRLGYYRTPIQKFGEQGDFVTAPLISPLFAECFVRFCLDSGLSMNILEVGAGNGMFAAQFLKACEEQKIELQQYFILELSGDSRQRQKENIEKLCPHSLSKVVWLNDLPDDFSGYVIANELLDAMPVRRFKKQDGFFYEQYVVCENNEFVYDYRALSDSRLLNRVKNLFPDDGENTNDENYLSEVNFVAEDWIRTLAGKLEKAIVLLIDYGYPRPVYYHAQRTMGTMMCHYQQRAHSDALNLLGLQDLTAHVDFTAIADAALDADLEVRGLATQAHFLLNSGILDLLKDLESKTIEEQIVLTSQVKKLTLPSEMGEAFKVLALSKNVDSDIIGFQQYDIRHLL